MERARAAILEGTFEALRAEFLAGFTPPDAEVREAQRQKRAARTQP